MLESGLEVRARVSDAVSLLALLTAVTAPAAALAQDQSDPDDEQAKKAEQTIIVTGTRREGVTYLESARPVDIISADVLNRQGASNLNDALRVAVPSLNGKRPVKTVASYGRFRENGREVGMTGGG